MPSSSASRSWPADVERHRHDRTVESMASRTTPRRSLSLLLLGGLEVFLLARWLASPCKTPPLVLDLRVFAGVRHARDEAVLI